MSVDPVEAIVLYLVFVVSATVHEAAHAWVAKRGGDLTAYLGGQVSLDPRPHIRREPMGMLVLPAISVFTIGWPFGFASSPYDPRWARRHPRRAAWMALAGPAANLALVVAAGALIRLALAAGLLGIPASVSFAAVAAPLDGPLAAATALVLSVFFSLNLVLLTLNLIPLPPLDGHAALGLLLPEHALLRYQQALQRSGVGWLGILIAWWIFPRVFQPLFLAAVNLLYPGVTYG